MRQQGFQGERLSPSSSSWRFSPSSLPVKPPPSQITLKRSGALRGYCGRRLASNKFFCFLSSIEPMNLMCHCHRCDFESTLATMMKCDTHAQLKHVIQG